jgi:hypothetical protein
VKHFNLDGIFLEKQVIRVTFVLFLCYLHQFVAVPGLGMSLVSQSNSPWVCQLAVLLGTCSS